MRSSILAALLLLGFGAGCSGDAKLECSYRAKSSGESPTPELQARGPCATLEADGTLRVDPEHLEKLDFQSGLGSILVASGWYYVTPAGRTAPVLTFDNGADYFVEGLARTRRAGRVGFIDHSLSEVIAPQWDFAFPFRDGVSVVCQGCRAHPTGDGEHSELRGGLWGYIDHQGAIVVPVRFERDALPEPAPGGGLR